MSNFKIQEATGSLPPFPMPKTLGAKMFIIVYFLASSRPRITKYYLCILDTNKEHEHSYVHIDALSSKLSGNYIY